jgi:hypothetical protein
LRFKLISALEDTLRFGFKEEELKKRDVRKYVGDLQQWLQELKPTDFRGKIAYLFRGDRWHHALVGDEESWRAEIARLARLMFENPDTFQELVDYLSTPDLSNVDILGLDLGKLDKSGIYIDLIFQAALRKQSTALARGYVAGFASDDPRVSANLNKAIDQVEKDNAAVAFDLFAVGGRKTHALDRTLRLVDSGRLSPRYLRGFSMMAGRDLTAGEVAQLLDRFIRTSGEDPKILADAIEFIGSLLKTDGKSAEPVLDNPDVRRRVWRVADATTVTGQSGSYWWKATVRGLSTYEAEKAIAVAASGLVADDFGRIEACQELLIEFAKARAKYVMTEVGGVMLDDVRGWRFFAGNYRPLIGSIPAQVVTDWLLEHGVEGARRVARHLPKPYLS